jgi:hypothetical protein
MLQYLKELRTGPMQKKKDQGLAGLDRFNQSQRIKRKESVRRMRWHSNLCNYHLLDLREHLAFIIDISMEETLI